MKRLTIILAALLMVPLVRAQQGNFTKVTSQQFVVQPAGAPTAAGSLAASPAQPGTSTIYGWIVSTNSAGSVLAGPWVFAGMPTPSSTVPIEFTWQPSADTSSYALLITSSLTPPTGACGCQVNSGSTGLTYFKWTGGYQAYTVPQLLIQSTMSSDSPWVNVSNGITTQLGSSSSPQDGQTFLNSPLFFRLYDDSASSTNSQAQADSRIAPMLNLQTTESGDATMSPLYFFSKSEAGANGGGLYGLIGSVDAQTGSRPNVVANNLVAGADQEYNITGITRSSNVVTATISSSLGAPNTFAVGDCVLVNGVADTSFDSGTICETVTAVSDSAMTVTWAQTGTNASSSGGTIAVGSQFFGLELDVFSDAYDPQPLTPTIAENVGPLWGYVSTGVGAYPGTAAFFSDGKWHNGFVCSDGEEACFVAGYPNATGSPANLGSTIGFLSSPSGYATSSQNFSSVPTVWRDSFYSGGEVEHNFTVSMQVGTGSSPSEELQFCFQTNSVCGLSLTSGGQIVGVNGSAAAPAFAFSANTNTGFWNSGGAVHLTEGGTDRFIFLAPSAGTTTLATGPNSVTLTTPSSGGTIGIVQSPGVFSGVAACTSSLEGTMAAVTDSTTNTWGATITGGGADHVLAYCDGTNWTVAAK